MLAFINLPVAIAVTVALGIVLYLFYLIRESDLQASATLSHVRRRHGYVPVDTQHYRRILDARTSVRVPQERRQSALDRFLLDILDGALLSRD